MQALILYLADFRRLDQERLARAISSIALLFRSPGSVFLILLQGSEHVGTAATGCPGEQSSPATLVERAGEPEGNPSGDSLGRADIPSPGLCRTIQISPKLIFAGSQPCPQERPRLSAAISTIALPIVSEAVAAGDGTFSTCSTLPDGTKWKSSTKAPSGFTA